MEQSFLHNVVGTTVHMTSLNISQFKYKTLRGRFKIRNTIICGKSPKGGGGVRAKTKKVYISNVDSL